MAACNCCFKQKELPVFCIRVFALIIVTGIARPIPPIHIIPHLCHDCHDCHENEATPAECKLEAARKRMAEATSCCQLHIDLILMGNCQKHTQTDTSKTALPAQQAGWPSLLHHVVHQLQLHSSHIQSLHLAGSAGHKHSQKYG